MESLATIPFYTSPTPSLEEIVVAEVEDFNDIRVNLFLVEYGRAKAFLPTSEINVKRGRRVRDYIKVGQEIAVQVIRISGENIDVSMKIVKEEEKKEAFDRYHRALRVHKVIGSACNYKYDAVIEKYNFLRAHYSDVDLYKLFEMVKEDTIEIIDKDVMKAIEERMP
jgi:translation initiation factor 2 alpha subunit (eIF-2alpha)